MRKPIIAGNWKMYKTQSEAKDLAEKILSELKNINTVDAVLIPTFTSLSTVYNVIKNSNVKLGAQNLHFEKEGAFTGEISPQMIKDVGCEYAVIGHSERRQYFCETDELINKKIKASLEVELLPIFCVGESLTQRESNQHENIVSKQIEIGLKGITKEQISKIFIAYEPVWAIGTGKTATPEIANAMHTFIRNKITSLYDVKISENIKILYGGSVKPENISELIKEKDIDGALVGGASLKAESFVNIVKGCL